MIASPSGIRVYEFTESLTIIVSQITDALAEVGSSWSNLQSFQLNGGFRPKVNIHIILTTSSCLNHGC